MSLPPYHAPFEVLPGNLKSPLVLCDHASAAIPREFSDLGLDILQQRSHIAWDPGAAGVTRELANALRAPAILGGSSRLLCDLNRHPDSPHLILVESDGHMIPGNVHVPEPARRDRLDRYFWPYHAAIERHLDAVIEQDLDPLLVSIHSFTPELWGLRRPWPIGVMWKQTQDWIPPLLAHFREQGIEVGDNQPYDGRDSLGFSLEYHGLQRGVRHVLFEIRQDLLVSAEEQIRWGRCIAHALRRVGLVHDTD